MQNMQDEFDQGLSRIDDSFLLKFHFTEILRKGFSQNYRNYVRLTIVPPNTSSLCSSVND